MKRCILLLVLIGVVFTAPGASSQAQDDELPFFTIEHDGETRSFSLYIPDGLTPNGEAPLLIALHPWASSGKAFQAMAGLDTVADELGMVVAYPDALSFSWDDGRSLYQDRMADAFPRDDEGFLLALVDAINEIQPIDGDSVTMAGLGNGGAMAATMACNHPDRVGHLVVTGSLLSTYQRENCATDIEGRVDVLYMVGEWDRFAGPDGRNIIPPTRNQEAVSVLSLNDTLAFWQERSGCEIIEPHTRNESLAVSAFECEATIAAITLAGVGHHWLRVGDYELNQYGVDMSTIMQDFLTLSPDDFVTAVEAIDYTTDVFGEWTRSYRAYVPPEYDPSQNYPVVVALHGRPDNGYGVAYILNMNDTAREEGFIVVYPDGKNEGWNYTRGYEGFGSLTDQDDVTFLELLIEDLALDYSIDRDHLYLMGFSNGGFMTVRMACEAPETFAGYAVIGGGMMELLLGDYCYEPVNMAIIHGTADPSINFDGIEQAGIWVNLPTLSHVTFWAELNGCLPENASQQGIDIVDDDGSSVVQFDFGECDTNKRLRFWMILGGGHTIPGTPSPLGEIFGPTNQDIDTAQVLWDFWTEAS